MEVFLQIYLYSLIKIQNKSANEFRNGKANCIIMLWNLLFQTNILQSLKIQENVRKFESGLLWNEINEQVNQILHVLKNIGTVEIFHDLHVSSAGLNFLQLNLNLTNLNIYRLWPLDNCLFWWLNWLVYFDDWIDLLLT